MKLNKPIVSSSFDLDDIRKIRDYNSMRHNEMTPSEIVEDTKANAAALIEKIKNRKTDKKVIILSTDTQKRIVS